MGRTRSRNRRRRQVLAQQVFHLELLLATEPDQPSRRQPGRRRLRLQLRRARNEYAGLVIRTTVSPNLRRSPPAVDVHQQRWQRPTAVPPGRCQGRCCRVPLDAVDQYLLLVPAPRARPAIAADLGALSPNLRRPVPTAPGPAGATCLGGAR
jgi:hypothetical protein